MRQILIVKFIYIHSFILFNLFNYLIDQSLLISFMPTYIAFNTMENALVWRRRSTLYIHYIHLFDRSISTHFIHLIDRYQKKVFGELYLGVAAAKVFMRARQSDSGGGGRRRAA
jgi:hypothetical protein